MDRRVLEVGSWDKNGSVRQLFERCQYTGVDIAEGNGVDFVCAGHELEFPSGYFDTVLSGECFEHNRFWLETLVNMVRMLRPGGLCMFTCAGMGRGEHGTRRMMPNSSLTSQTGSDDYYLNLTSRDFTQRIDLSAHFDAWMFSRNFNHLDLYFVGVKKGGTATSLECAMEAVTREAKHIDSSSELTKRELLRTFFKSRIRFLLANLIGDARFHDFEYSVRRLVRLPPFR